MKGRVHTGSPCRNFFCFKEFGLHSEFTRYYSDCVNLISIGFEWILKLATQKMIKPQILVFFPEITCIIKLSHEHEQINIRICKLP